MEGYLTRSKKVRQQEVDELSDKLTQYEEDLAEQRDRLFSLREENRLLKDELERYRSNEKYMTETMINAQKTAERVIADAEVAAAKRLYGVQEQERRIRENIAGYQAQLIELERHASRLLSSIVETMSSLRLPEPEKEISARDLFANISSVISSDEVA